MSSVVPDYCAPLVGYRKWNLTNDGRLTSVTSDERWPARQPLRAVCRMRPKPVITPPVFRPADPPWGCRGRMLFGTPYNPTWANGSGDADACLSDGFVCDLIAIALQVVPLQLIRYCDAPNAKCYCGIYAHAEPVFEYEGFVSGEVSLWGRVMKGERGYRAQFAYPKSLTLHYPDEAMARRIADTYGVPCVVGESIVYDRFPIQRIPASSGAARLYALFRNGLIRTFSG